MRSSSANDSGSGDSIAIPELIGKQLSLNGRSFTVIGIMPAKFEFPLPLFNVQGGTFGQRVDIWKPIAFTKNELESRGSRSYGVVARLKSGFTIDQARAELETVVGELGGPFFGQLPGGESIRRRPLSIS